MPPSSLTAALALGVSVISIACYHLALVGPRLRALSKRLEAATNAASGSPLSEPALLARIEERLAELERIGREVPRIGFVRYNAFADVGSELSYAVALLDSQGDGVVLTSIFSREETRTFGKRVRKYLGDQDVSKEERDAIALARVGVSVS
ncbi:MAG TPA: DUF4446 family protein [Candidatus Acidoferrales bacterium]|nr:DUF4446 family protein [Candidatus Acidoferrales bacterium]